MLSNPNIRPSDRGTVLGQISPVSQGVGTAVTGWLSVKELFYLLAEIKTGVLGASATVDAKIQQATTSGGAGAKDVTGAAITQLTKAAANDNSVALINLRVDALDTANGFGFVQLSITVGTAASLVGATLYGFDAGYQPKAHAAAVVQVV